MQCSEKQEKLMKKAIIFVLTILTLSFAGCGNPVENNNSENGPGDTVLTINNQSSYDLLQLSYAGIDFGTIASNNLISKNVPEGTDRISFHLENSTGNVYCRTFDAITCNKAENREFVIINNSLVENMDNGEIDSIRNISILPASFELRQDGILISQQGEFKFGSILLGNTSQIIFAITNTGGENLIIQSVNGRLVNLENDAQNNFTVTQPSLSTIMPDGTTTFRITFNPKIAENNLSTIVNIKTNIRNNSDFSFTVRGNGKAYYVIGDEGPAGGLIFYDAVEVVNGWRYLEAAPSITERTASWGGNGSNVAGTQTAFGTGKQNTDIIVIWLGLFGGTGKAAQICNDMVYKGYNDWFLPSRGELDLVYKNLKQNGFGEFANGNYWSSSQYYENVAYGINFSDGRVSYGNKNTYGDSYYIVRAIRAF
jgi:hypothetical protein